MTPARVKELELKMGKILEGSELLVLRLSPPNPSTLRSSPPKAPRTSQSSLPPSSTAVFTRFTSPPITLATYSTVQTSANTHIELNSDLVYINHSYNPSLIFDISNMEIRTTHEIKVGDELTFFYPSTEWDMVQLFECFFGESCCCNV
jgi:hypothetical protein